MRFSSPIFLPPSLPSSLSRSLFLCANVAHRVWGKALKLAPDLAHKLIDTLCLAEDDVNEALIHGALGPGT